MHSSAQPSAFSGQFSLLDSADIAMQLTLAWMLLSPFAQHLRNAWRRTESRQGATTVCFSVPSPSALVRIQKVRGIAMACVLLSRYGDLLLPIKLGCVSETQGHPRSRSIFPVDALHSLHSECAQRLLDSKWSQITAEASGQFVSSPRYRTLLRWSGDLGPLYLLQDCERTGLARPDCFLETHSSLAVVSLCCIPRTDHRPAHIRTPTTGFCVPVELLTWWRSR